MNPFVSVLIPAFNARRTIVRALQSVVIQKYQPLEIIVVNDASTDDTASVVQRLNLEEVRLIELPANLGECGAMNAGLALARGKYIAFLDADDEWRPNKLGRQIELLEQNPGMVFATCGCLFVAPDGTPAREFGVHPPLPANEIWRALLARGCVAKPCVVANASVLKKVGDFDVNLRVAGDQDMWIRLAANGDVGFLEEILVWAHDTPGSLTKVNAKKSADYVIPMVERNIRLLRDRLSPAEIRHILGERYSFVGRNLYASGSAASGLRYLAKGMAKGSRIRENSWYAITASAPARLVKAQIRHRLNVGATVLGEGERAGRSRLLRPDRSQIAEFPDGPPILSVVVDTEAEFDWSLSFKRDMTSVTNIKYQERAQNILTRYNIKPTYAIAYAVAVQENGIAPLLELLQSNVCTIGAHLQPWENPPFEESLGRFNSYVSNLPFSLQHAKLAHLTRAIEDNFHVRPVVYKAGRYGISEELGNLLEVCGYEIDLSVLPARDLRPDGGPDFSDAFNRPYWFGSTGQLFEIPMTVGLVGALSNPGAKLYRMIGNEPLNRIHVPGVFARLGLLERITLTPEGVSLDEMKRLTRSMHSKGNRTFTLTYHSPSLVPGNTPYVRNGNDLQTFLARLEGYLEFFFGEMRGMTMDVIDVRNLARANCIATAFREQASDDSTHRGRRPA